MASSLATITSVNSKYLSRMPSPHDDIKQPIPSAEGSARTSLQSRLLAISGVVAFAGGALLALSGRAEESRVAESDRVAVSSRIRAALQEVDSRVVPDEIRPSAIMGLWEVVTGTQVVYVTADAKHAIDGAVIDLVTSENLTEVTVMAARGELLTSLSDADLMIYPAVGKAQKRIYVFTDYTCPYCQKFHGQLADIASAGIEVVYLAFPRSGPGSLVADQLSNAFCSSDRVASFDTLMAGGTVGSSRCLSPVDYHHALGERLGVSGTPAIFADDGRQLGGFLPTEELKNALGLSAVQPK